MEYTGLKTEFRLKKEARELEIYNEYNQMKAQPGAMTTAVNKFLVQKHELGSETTVWAIRKRVEKRLGQQEGK